MMNRVDTLIICDGGRRDEYGFDAAYIPILGVPIIGYSIIAGVESKYIKKIYLYSDLEEKAYNTAKELYPDDKQLKVLYADAEIPDLHPNDKVLRIIPAESKLVMSISKTFYKHIVNDIPELGKFTGEWKDANNIKAYQKSNPRARELAIAFMANDQPLCKAADLDEMIEAYNQELYDSLIGYTKKEDLNEYLAPAGVSINEFHRTLQINDFIDGEWMRHNCLFILKWGKMDKRLVEVISFYNQHRVQSKAINFILVFLKIISEYYGIGREIIRVLLMGCIFGVGKYFRNFHNSWIREFVARSLNNKKISECTKKLVEHRVSIFYKGSATSVIDIDEPKDIDPVQQLLLFEERRRLEEESIENSARKGSQRIILS
jgi:CMP-N-acetylneuraminic acid synthetase